VIVAGSKVAAAGSNACRLRDGIQRRNWLALIWLFIASADTDVPRGAYGLNSGT
jgi:hypothetical protein